MTTDQAKLKEVTIAKYRTLKGLWRWIAIIIPVIVVFLGLNDTFEWRFFADYMLYEMTYKFILVALLLSLAFLWVPFKPGLKGGWARRLFWVDVAIFIVAFGICIYFAIHGMEMVSRGWARVAPPEAVVMAVILWFILMEAVRRTVGMVLGVFVFIVAFYPLYAEYLPGIFHGISRPFLLTAQFHIMSTDSAMGILLATFARIIIAFTLFGVVAIGTGGGRVFLNLALSIFGRMRGGPAKVAVVASALFGSISGSSVANVITTGSVTIPAMKKSGFEPHVAGAVETCSSTAGTFTPPIMGAAAFVMASFLGISYAEVALAATIPAILFYLALYTQIDGYAAKKGLLGLTKEKTPSFLSALKEGWFFIPVFATLIYYLFILRLVAEAAYVSTAVMLVLAQVRKETRFSKESFLSLLENAGQTLMELLVVMAGVSMLLGSFSIVGLAAVLPRELLNLAGGSPFFMLVMCAIAGLIMGMGMTLIAVYVFLSIVIAPALITAGINPLAAHLFILYTGMLSYITPPVALCAFAAAPIAQASAMRIGLTAVRLGGAIYVIPFFFVYGPGLIMQADISTILLTTLTAGIGIFVIASAFEGYLLGIGKLWANREGGYSWWSYLLRVPLITSGMLMAIPEWTTDLIGLTASALLLLAAYLLARRHGAR